MQTKLTILGTVIICEGNDTLAIRLYIEDMLGRAVKSYNNALDKAKTAYNTTLPEYPTDVEKYWFKLQDKLGAYNVIKGVLNENIEVLKTFPNMEGNVSRSHKKDL